jgi:hypothetical protein
MHIKDLKIGDILLFSPEKGSFISWAITYLTDAPVSHAAMFYDEEKQLIIEETPPQVKLSSAAERFKDREIYVRRLKEDLPLSPVIGVSTSYLNAAEPYAMSGLYMVGLLLIYRKFTPNTKTQKVIVKILKKLTASIVEYINEHENPGKLPMVCSQFVAQCYDDAGDKYQLIIDNGILQKMTATKDNTSVLDNVIEVINSGQRMKLQTSLVPNLEVQDDSSSSGEELCEELKESFNLTTSETTAEISDELVDAVAQFAYAHYLSDSGKNQTKNISQEDATKVLQKLNNYKNMFTFPGDLLDHCDSLRDAGII